MIKTIYTILLSVLVAAPLWAQPSKDKKDGVVFAPRKGQWQVSLVLGGTNSAYDDLAGTYLLPKYSNTGGTIGLPNGGTNTSGELTPYLNISGLNNNSLVNIVGLQGKYFFSDCWSVSLSMGLNVNLTPKKDYIEGDDDVPDMAIPAQAYVNAQATNNWYVTAGTERYFKTSNPRIHPYVGVAAGFQMTRIETTEPYTGKTAVDADTGESEDIHVFMAAGKVGQMYGIKGALVSGVEYSLAQGLILGFEFQPLAYRYDVIQIAPQGFDKYNLSHHNIKVFDMPVLKLGFRF